RNIFALIIGINIYADAWLKLKGCVADANAIRDYFAQDLHVPAENIRILLDHQATRSRMLEELLAFQTDPRIAKGDSIVVYYAGHGTEAVSPPGWEDTTDRDRIMMIVPHDFTISEDIEPIYGIPYRTMDALLH
ncbi:hypothetical protein M422DRAFT_81642, partial [Sphaerobolus stellatus SS14]